MHRRDRTRPRSAVRPSRHPPHFGVERAGRHELRRPGDQALTGERAAIVHGLEYGAGYEPLAQVRVRAPVYPAVPWSGEPHEFLHLGVADGHAVEGAPDRSSRASSSGRVNAKIAAARRRTAGSMASMRFVHMIVNT